VVYGSNVTDEMADVYLQVTPVRPDQRALLMEHYKQYDLHSQIAGYRKSLELDASNVWSQEALATSHVGLNEPKLAIAILDERLKSGPKAVYPVASLGMALLADGDPAKALEQFQRAVAMDSNYPLAWLGLGKSLGLLKQHELAEQAYRRTVE